MMRRPIGWLLTTALACGALNACSEIEPGDYKVYRVALEKGSLSEGCYWQFQGADANERDDRSTVRKSGTFVLYAGEGGKFYLDTGEGALEGGLLGSSGDADVYEFTGKSVDVEWQGGEPSQTRFTTTHRLTVDMNVDGALTFGTLKDKVSYACSGTGCGEAQPSCTTTSDFVGTEVEDVQLEYAVPGSGSSGPPDPDGLVGISGPTGSGGSSAGGGSSTGGGGDGCLTCSLVLASNGDFAVESVCSGSLTLLTDLANCACSSQCAEVCTQLCGDATGASASCLSCVSASSECTAANTACMQDSAG